MFFLASFPFGLTDVTSKCFAEKLYLDAECLMQKNVASLGAEVSVILYTFYA